MRTVGVDLAAELGNTAIAVIEWRGAGAQVAAVKIPADDDAVLRHVEGADKVGIDCPWDGRTPSSSSCAPTATTW